MKIAIIGSGAAGLAALRHSLDEGHSCMLFERNNYIGGTWKYVDKTGLDQYGLPIHTSMYEHLRTNLPKELMQFEDFPYPDLDYSYLSHEQVLRYINRYAEAFNLIPHIRFATHIVEIDPLPRERWSVKLNDLKRNREEDLEFDAVMICIGNYSVPFTPHFLGIETFKGKAIHSHNYRKTSPYKNRRVVVVGAGFSGVDISKALAPVAKKVILSHKGEMTINVTLPSTVLIKPVIKQFDGSNVIFKDNTECEADAVIFCTGYYHSYPFLTPKCGITVKNNYISSMYKYIVNVEHPTMAFIGAAKHVPIFPTVGLQVRFHLALLRGQFKITKQNMIEDVNKYKCRCKELGQSIDQNLEKNHLEYLNDLATTAKVKGVPEVISTLYDYVLHEKFQIFNLKYRILNDKEFECCECNYQENIHYIV